ncbi:MAG: 4Fe-4S binding protein, partial [Armatimonadetes bacterium]|nr:4Fe-4S binding protein [Armatimonadota bacterium]
MRTVRRAVQLLFLAAFAWLIFQTRWQPGAEPAKPFFLRLDPLSMLTTALSPAPQVFPFFVPALVLLFLTVVFGRFFCGWVCPLGTVIDICDVTLWRRRSSQPSVNLAAAKFLLLATVLAAAIFGAQIAWIFDPIPLITRTCATVVSPIGQEISNWLITVGRPLLR